MNEEAQAMVMAIAERLWTAQVEGRSCGPPSVDWPTMDVAMAYAVQHQLMTWRQERGGTGGKQVRAVGRKIGLTSPAVQEWLGVSEPDFGVLLDDMVQADSTVISTSSLLQPRAEAEVAFVLAQDLAGPGVTAADVMRATAYIIPALEIIDSRIADWNITYEDTIADNASSGLFVLGNHPRLLTEVDLRLAGMALRKNGQVVSTGAGAACLGHPINAVVWLANKLAEFGQGLKAGEVVLSGALGPVTEVAAGDWLSAEISGVGSINVRFGE